MIDAALRWKLQQSAPLVALVGDRIMADVIDVPERASDILSSVYYTLTDYRDQSAGIGAASVERVANYEIWCVASTPDAAIAIALEVEAALHFQVGVWNANRRITAASLVSARADVLIGNQARAFSRVLEFEFRYLPAS